MGISLEPPVQFVDSKVDRLYSDISDLPHNKQMQSDIFTRYARENAVDLSAMWHLMPRLE